MHSVKGKMGAIRNALLFIILYNLQTIGDVDCECHLSLNDFKIPAPLFIRNNSYLVPDASGAISVSRSGIIVVACPRKKVVLGNSTTSYDVMEAHCINNKTFRVDRWIGAFENITCSGNPYIESQNTARPCLNGGEIYQIGYKIRSKFYPSYEVCFNQNTLSTSFVKHELLPTSVYMQKGGRPSFVEGDLFKKIKMSKIYKVEYQKKRFDAILGLNMSQNYITKKQFLSRGHLAARADFTFMAQIRATFHYANAVPQFQRGNAGDWAALEEALRRRVKRLGRPLTLFTGTHDTLSLPDSRSVWRPITLYSDENNNDLVPVPLYNFKLVYDKATKTATAFISINTSFYNSSRVKELTFCDDLCTEREFSWLTWRPDDGTHSFCCDYIDFTKNVGQIENLDIRGPFY